MTNSFDKRQKGYEAKWAHDEETRFKVYARRNKLLGVWAAGEMGLSGAAADAYAKEVVAADFEKPGEEDVFEKVRRDFDAKGLKRILANALIVNQEASIRKFASEALAWCDEDDTDVVPALLLAALNDKNDEVKAAADNARRAREDLEMHQAAAAKAK